MAITLQPSRKAFPLTQITWVRGRFSISCPLGLGISVSLPLDDDVRILSLELSSDSE
jgi:hypothetical protein